jgi:uncharacterized membrane protein (Fun14 family)
MMQANQNKTHLMPVGSAVGTLSRASKDEGNGPKRPIQASGAEDCLVWGGRRRRSASVVCSRPQNDLCLRPKRSAPAPQLPLPLATAARSPASDALRQARLRSTYAYAGASLAITAVSTAICFATPALAATSLATQLGVGVLLPTAMGWALMQRRDMNRVVQQVLWLSFSLLSGYGLLMTGAAGLAMMGAATALTVVLYAPLIWGANRPGGTPPNLASAGSEGASANTMASLYGLNHGGALTLFVDPSFGGKMLQVLLSGFNLFLGIDFAVQHMCEVHKKAGEDRPFNDIAESIYLYTNFMSLYWTMARFLLPPPGSPVRPTA